MRHDELPPAARAPARAARRSAARDGVPAAAIDRATGLSTGTVSQRLRPVSPETAERIEDVSIDDVSARDELIRRAAARGHHAEAEAYFAKRDSGQPVEMTDNQLTRVAEAPRTLRIGITNPDGHTFWLGSYNQATAPVSAYDAVSVSDEELDRLAEEWGPQVRDRDMTDS